MDFTTSKSFKFFFLVLICVKISSSEPPTHKKSSIYSAWPAKDQFLSHQSNGLAKNKPKTLVIQIRSDTAMPSLILKHRSPHMHSTHHHAPPPPSSHHHQLHHHQALVRPMRPVKMAITPQFIIKSGPMISKLARKPKPIIKITSNKVKPPEDYVYEKPFTSTTSSAGVHKSPIENNIRLTNGHFGPIHTIPAPNLGQHVHDNHLHSESTLSTYPTYQVTEEQTNDQTIHDPYLGQNKYFAPDPDPSLPSAKIHTPLDPFSIPSNGKPLPLDVQNNYLSSAPITTVGLIPQPVIQFVNPIGTDYHSTLQQPYLPTKLSLPAYDPTYLVTQSNNLYNQHQQKQLFKPNPNYIGAYTGNLVDPINEVASTGQILEAARDPANHIHPQYSHEGSASQNNPTFAALIGGGNYQPSSENHISDNSIDNQNSQSGFVVSTYYDNNQNPQSYQQYMHLTQKQRENDRTLEQAYLDLHNQLIVQNAQQYAYDNNDQNQQLSNLHQTTTTSEPLNAYEEHKKLVDQQLGTSSSTSSPSPLRIFVPDDDYHDQNNANQIFKKRSDENYSSQEHNTESFYEDELTEDYNLSTDDYIQDIKKEN